MSRYCPPLPPLALCYCFSNARNRKGNYSSREAGRGGGGDRLTGGDIKVGAASESRKAELYVISSVAAAALPLQAAISLCPSLSLSLSLSLSSFSSFVNNRHADGT